MPLEKQIITPENIVIRYQLAGPVSRGVAWMNDFVFQGILIGIGVLFINIFFSGYSVRSVNEVLTVIHACIILFGYHTYFDIFAEGRSPGKKSAGIRVVRLDGQSIDFFPSIIRNLLRIVDFLPIGFLLGVITMLMNEQHQRIGDLLAQTLVIREPSRPPDKEPIVGFVASDKPRFRATRSTNNSSARPVVQKPIKRSPSPGNKPPAPTAKPTNTADSDSDAVLPDTDSEEKP
ncbi:MAG: RDD family protein [Candidatus Riflebacteria bacterium]|nr:RDD family protein [Candidatus Riflebacteria bacterium]